MNFDPQTVQYRFCGNLLCVSERLEIATNSGFDFAQLRGCAIFNHGRSAFLSKISCLRSYSFAGPFFTTIVNKR
jgi:hypothetical protein